MKHPLSRFAPSPLSLRGRGTHPVAWQSQFHGCAGLESAGFMVAGGAQRYRKLR